MQWKRKNGLDGVTQQSKNKGASTPTWDTSSGATVEGKTVYLKKKAETLSGSKLSD